VDAKYCKHTLANQSVTLYALSLNCQFLQ